MKGFPMIQYGFLLRANIEAEKNGTGYICPEEDKPLRQALLDEVNKFAGTDFHYLAELDAFNIHGAGDIMARYITRFTSEFIRSYLVPQLVSDKIKDCDKLVLQLYRHFRSSDVCFIRPGHPTPAEIYLTYDNALRRLKPKRLAKDLVEIVRCPWDAFQLAFTVRMLASWKIPEMKDILIACSSPENIPAQDLGEKPDSPRVEAIKRQLIFRAIGGLKYFPSEETTEIITRFASDPDRDIKMAAEKTLKALAKYS